MFENFQNFTYSSESSFPKEECTIQNERELDVFESPNVYQVLYIDIRFRDEKMLDFARPYIWKGENGEIGFGWLSATSSRIFGNVENTCQFYDEFVVGYIPIDQSVVESDRTLFEKYKKTIDEQYEKFTN